MRKNPRLYLYNLNNLMILPIEADINNPNINQTQTTKGKQTK